METKTKANKFGGMMFGIALSLSCMVTPAYAADNTAQTISNITGWSAEDVQIVLNEDIRNNYEITPEEAEISLLGEMRSYSDDFMNRGIKFEVFAGIAAFETGHFQHLYLNNVGGIIDINGNYKSYPTIHDGIEDMNRLLTNEYIAEDGMWSVGDNFTIMGLAEHYNTNIEWLAGYVDVRLSMQRRIERSRFDEY